MKRTELLLQAARNNAQEILISADTLQEIIIGRATDNINQRNMITAAKQIRLNACRILATSDRHINKDSKVVSIYPDILIEQLQGLIDGDFEGASIKELIEIMAKAAEAGRVLASQLTKPTDISLRPRVSLRPQEQTYPEEAA